MTAILFRRLIHAKTGAKRALAKCLALLLVLSTWTTSAFAQRGNFDSTTPNPKDEAYIFTPRGSDKIGVLSKVTDGPHGKLRVIITDVETGKPTFCRVNVVGNDGNYYQPKENSLAAFGMTGEWPKTGYGNRVGKAPIRYFGRFFYTSGVFDIEVPAGKTRVEVWKGFEYAPAQISARVPANHFTQIGIKLERTAPMLAEGYFSGDTHLHLPRNNDADAEICLDLLEAEDVQYGGILCYNLDTSHYSGVMDRQDFPQRQGLGAASERARGKYRILSGQEYRSGQFGHLKLFLRDNLFREGDSFDPNLGPPFGVVGRETRGLGGFAFHAHGGYAQEIWADFVQGSVDGVELLQFGIYRGIGLEGWYKILNAGYRFPAIGASDFPPCRKMSDCRTYVHHERVPDFAGWLRALAEGKSFVTTGPLLLFDVEGHGPGATIDRKGPGPHSIKVRVRARGEVVPIQHVQCIVGGKIRKQWEVPQEEQLGRWFTVEETMEIDASTWIAARAFSLAPTGSPDGESHTNPVHVTIDGKRPFDHASIDWLVKRIDEQIEEQQKRNHAGTKEILAYFHTSKQLLLDRVKQEIQASSHPPNQSTSSPLQSDDNPSSPRSSPRRVVGNHGPTGVPKNDQETAAPSSAASLDELLKPIPPKTPREALASIEVLPGFHLELVAHEPAVSDPIAAAFDEKGRLYVAEMIDYPFKPREGEAPLGRVRLLEDQDGDGRFETSHDFAEGLLWPAGIACWKQGVYVAAAPHVWYFKDTDGDGRADVREIVFTGFGTQNQQAMVNNLAWGLDHKIYGSVAANGGALRPGNDPDAEPLDLQGCDFRFDPATRTVERITGRAQFGNTFDDWGNRFLCSESQPTYQEVLPLRYLARNPYLPVSSALINLVSGVTPIHRVSPIEGWRRIRTDRRMIAGERSPDSAGASHDVLDGAAGVTVYRGNAYPPEMYGTLFLGDAQNNLVHRRRLEPMGVLFQSERIDKETEIVRSTDNWFRPVNFVNAPDGTLHVLDMSREIIESIHIPTDVFQKLDLKRGRDQGRIYRLAPDGFRMPTIPQLGLASTRELVGLLEHPNAWHRDTAQRLLFERQDKSAASSLRELHASSDLPQGRLGAIVALSGLGVLSSDDVARALEDPFPAVREHAVRLAETLPTFTDALGEKIVALSEDPSPRVRFQVAFTLGEVGGERALEGLARIGVRDAGDTWIRTAALTSSAQCADRLLQRILDQDVAIEGSPLELCRQLAGIVGRRHRTEEVSAVLATMANNAILSTLAKEELILAILEPIHRSGTDWRSSVTDDALAMLDAILARAVDTAIDASRPVPTRLSAIRLLSLNDHSSAERILRQLLLDDEESEPVRAAALHAIASRSPRADPSTFLAAHATAPPNFRTAILATLITRKEWIPPLLEAIQRGDIPANALTSPQKESLRNHRDETVRATAERVIPETTASRREVIARYLPALEAGGNGARGAEVFKRTCAGCHQLAGLGFAVGPNLATAQIRSPEALLVNILDPNRDVQPAYVQYVVAHRDGRVLTGLLASDTPSSLSLKREQGATEVILKSEIEEMNNTGKSLMPENLETSISEAQMADLLAFLLESRYDRGSDPGFEEPGSK